ncbi:MAG: MFS transporter, partial [Thermoplasmata archaeon]
AISSAASVPALILWGNLSDAISKRKIFVLIGFFGGFASLAMMIFVHTVFQFIDILVLFQVLAVASVPVSTIMILESNTTEKWAGMISRFSMVSGIGTVLGTVIGIVFIVMDSSPSNLPYVYVLSSVAYLFSAIIAVFVIKEPSRIISRNWLSGIHINRIFERTRYFPTSVIHFVAVPFRSRGERINGNLKFFLFTTAFLMFGFQMFFVPFPVMVIKFNASTLDIFIMYMLNSVLSTVSFIYAGKIVNRFGGKTTLFFSLLTRIVIFGLAALIPVLLFGISALVVSIAIYALLGGVWSVISVSQVNYVSKNAGQKARGKAIGWYNSLLGMGQIFGGVASGYVSVIFGYSIDFVISSAIIAIGLGMVIAGYHGETLLKIRNKTNSA